MAIARRLFLKSSGVALAGLATTPSFLLRTAFAQDGDARGPDHPILIAIFQRGAADGVSMVVPFQDKHYYAARPLIAIPEPKRNDRQSAIDLDGFFGFHPALRPLKPIYDAGDLAVVHAVGSPDNTRSHFDAQDYMESGSPGNKAVADGWLNRYLQGNKTDHASAFRAVAFKPNLPRTLIGPAEALAMTRISDFSVRSLPSHGEMAQSLEALYAHDSSDPLSRAGRGTFEAIRSLQKANPAQYGPRNGAEYPNSSFGRALEQIAQLIKSDMGLEIAFTDIGGWDTHSNQGSSRGQLANRLQELGRGLSALYRDLGDRMRNVVVLTMTEFGRTIRQNGSAGTDHGHASCLFVLGGPVKGGKVYGEWPGLAPEQLYEGRDLALTTDFRDVFLEVAVRHLRAKQPDPIFPGFNSGSQNFLGVI